MMKHEFEAIVGCEVTRDDYEIIELVYTYHPSIGPCNGKVQIANIFNLKGGMRIIKDMVATAKIAQSLNIEEMSIGREIARLNDRLREVRDKIASL